MNKWLVLLLISLLVLPLSAGCGQKQEATKTPEAIKPAETVQEEVEMVEVEESDGAEVEEVPAVEQPANTPAEAPVPESPAPEAAKPSETLVVADFNSGEKPSNLGGNFGAWNKDPSDPTQWCKESFDKNARRGDKGFCMKLDYSVDSPNPAYNGFWMMLPNLDASKYDDLNFWVKGDTNAGYTTVFKIELKNANRQVGRYYVSNVSDQWQEVSIPLSELKGLIDKTALTEFVIVFEDRMATNKKGVIYIDDISFTKK